MSKFKKRTTAPSKDNKYYYSDNIFYKCGYGMPNCTCYAWGRFYELTGKYPKLDTGNAERWYNNTKDGYERGQTPKLGSIICWEGVGSKAGHVAVVEEIYSDGSILTSNSAYNSTNFYMKTLKPPKYYMGSSYEFEGFIHFPIEFEEEPVISKLNVLYQAYDNKKKVWLGVITNYNNTNSNGYAGIFGDALGGIKVKLSNGAKITIKSHVKGGSWLSEINKWDNTSNGYSGIKGKNIDGVCIKAEGYKIEYRVHTVNGKWLGWIGKYDPNDWIKGIAGIKGKSIDAIQIRLGE